MPSYEDLATSFLSNAVEINKTPLEIKGKRAKNEFDYKDMKRIVESFITTTSKEDILQLLKNTFTGNGNYSQHRSGRSFDINNPDLYINARILGDYYILIVTYMTTSAFGITTQATHKIRIYTSFQYSYIFDFFLGAGLSGRFQSAKAVIFKLDQLLKRDTADIFPIANALRILEFINDSTVKNYESNVLEEILKPIRPSLYKIRDNKSITDTQLEEVVAIILSKGFGHSNPETKVENALPQNTQPESFDSKEKTPPDTVDTPVDTFTPPDTQDTQDTHNKPEKNDNVEEITDEDAREMRRPSIGGKHKTKRHRKHKTKRHRKHKTKRHRNHKTKRHRNHKTKRHL
jgi:hypothetical protein